MIVGDDFSLSPPLVITNAGLLSVFDGMDANPDSLDSVFLSMESFSSSHANSRPFFL
ncbi:protein of unknown function [uncultured Woeseiaceae bacterium]|uniref:Uncharacterized protein n=1 Tax=uncultured Woeseiaceae bacterium TaxID=1983305 RepID=A0A7D9D362_9GAMM|nr:protein of unknown function [uncultured Woeseiaceae bacterium]